MERKISTEDAFSRGSTQQPKGSETWNTVSLLTGVLAFLLLFTKSAVFTILFGVFAFRSDLPSCLALEGVNVPLSVLSLQASYDPEAAALLADL